MIKYLILISLFECFISSPVQQSFDWRTKGAVLAVTNQGSCGSSSMTNALDAISSAHKIKGGDLVRLSSQQIYDCGGDLCPCQGSFGPNHIYDLIFKEQLENQIDSEQSYPYTGQCTKKCNFQKSGAVTALLGYYSPANTSTEDVLQELLTNGPLTVQIEASDAFMTYTSGILDDQKCTGAQLNHGLLLVGYGTEKGVDYWIARNSWGTTWGEKGYVRIVRGKNMCGIANQFAQPVVNN